MIGKIFHKFLMRFDYKNENTEIDLLKGKGLIIGEHTIVHSINCFDTVYPWLIEVGDHCLISTDVKIIAHDSSTNRIGGVTKVGRVTIGDHVYLGQGVTVLCNVNIGNNVVVGAKSLVNRDLPSEGVYAGNQVRYICSIEEFDQKHIHNFEIVPTFDTSRGDIGEMRLQWKNG